MSYTPGPWKMAFRRGDFGGENLAEKICSHVAIISKGKIVETGAPAHMKKPA